jgi:hypothetical protein
MVKVSDDARRLHPVHPVTLYGLSQQHHVHTVTLYGHREFSQNFLRYVILLLFTSRVMFLYSKTTPFPGVSSRRLARTFA